MSDQQTPEEKRAERVIRLAKTINALGARGWSDAMNQAQAHVSKTERKQVK